jgi:hypothetical protein
MCFSATASFASGSILALAGIATLHQTRSSEQWPLAAVPCLFALQQFSEGLTWLGVGGSLGVQHASVFLFLIFAQIVWPIWIPLALYMVAPPERKWPLGILLAVGSGVSLTMAGCMLLYGADAEIVGHHVAYTLPYPPLVLEFCGLLYGLVTIAPPFMTGLRDMWWLGVGIALSYLVSAYFYQYYVVSVWCYFSALLSVLIYVIQRVNWVIPASKRAAAMIPQAT